ncbi:hypothetical protein DXG03_005222, partial [Asterophora parasitica]
PIPEPEPAAPLDATPENQWSPFSDRLAFDWAQHHYVHLQSSEDEIHEGLEIWHATVIKHDSEHTSKGHVPWQNAHDLEATIDSIKAGAVGWKTYKFHYLGPKPQTAPQWMETEYKLNTCNVLEILEQQLHTSEFDGQCEYSPYEEYGPDGHKIYSNLMSAAWARQDCKRSLHSQDNACA